MESLKLLAAVNDLGLGSGLFKVNDAIRWSDKVIEVLDNPPFEFIELSMMSSAKINDVEGKLLDYYRSIDIPYVVNMILGLIHNGLSNNRLTIEEAIRYSARLLVHTNLYFQKEYYDLYCFEDDYDLATDGVYNNLRDVVRNFTESIGRYTSYFSDFTILYKTIMTFEWALEQ